MKILMLIFFCLSNYLFAEEKHTFYLQTGFGYAETKNANSAILEETNLKANALINSILFNRRSFTVPISKSDKEISEIQKSDPFSFTNLEYRYKDNLRFNLEHRLINHRDNSSTFVSILENQVAIIRNRFNSGLLESRSKVGISYYFPIFDFFKIGLGLNNYGIIHLNDRYSYGLSRSLERDYTVSKQKEYYYGFAPAVFLEWNPLKEIIVNFSYEVIDIKSSGSNIQAFRISNFRNNSYTYTTVQNKLKGSYNKLILIYRPLDWLGFHFGLVRELYQKVYGSEGFITSNYLSSDIYEKINFINNFVLQNGNFNQEIRYFYIQFEIRKGF